MIQVASKEEAIAWVRRWPAIDAHAEIEIRELFEPEDFAPIVEAAAALEAGRTAAGTGAGDARNASGATNVSGASGTAAQAREESR